MYRPGDVNFIKKDIALALKRYPKLSLVEHQGKYPALKGELDLDDVDTDIHLDTVQVYIQYLKSFPFSFPQVWEIGGRFRGQQDMHVNGDGTLCLATPPVEILKTRLGLTTIPFIETILIPNLAWRLAKILEPEVDMKASSHGTLGILEGYSDILGLDDKELTLRLLDKYINNLLPNRNGPCICGNHKKYKSCHEKKIEELGGIPRDTVKKHLEEIENNLN